MENTITNRAEYNDALERVKTLGNTLQELYNSDNYSKGKSWTLLSKVHRETRAIAKYVTSLGDENNGSARELAAHVIDCIKSNPKTSSCYMDKEMRLYVRTQYACHDHYNSPHESCDTCGNCSEAKCIDADPVIEWIVEDNKLPYDGDAIEGSIVFRDFVNSWSDKSTEAVRTFLTKYYTGLKKLDSAT